MDLFKHHQKCHPPTSFTSCSQWLGVCVLTIFHLKRLFKLLWQPQQCSLVTAIEVIMLFCPVLPGRYYLRHTAERQISFTEAGVMASWKNPIKKKAPLKLKEDWMEAIHRLLPAVCAPLLPHLCLHMQWVMQTENSCLIASARSEATVWVSKATEFAGSFYFPISLLSLGSQ